MGVQWAGTPSTRQGCSKPHPMSPSTLLGTGASLPSLALCQSLTHREQFIKSQPMQGVLTSTFSPKDVQIKTLGQGNPD